MAFGIDDTLTAAKSAVVLGDTLIQTIKKYRKSGQDPDIELLIEEIRIAALRRIDEADHELNQIERTLSEREVNLDRPLVDVISDTSWWRPFESYRMKQVHKRFGALQDLAYSSIDDIAALVRCKDQVRDMGQAVVESSYNKQEFQKSIVNASTVRETIDVLRRLLSNQKEALM